MKREGTGWPLVIKAASARQIRAAKLCEKVQPWIRTGSEQGAYKSVFLSMGTVTPARLFFFLCRACFIIRDKTEHHDFKFFISTNKQTNKVQSIY
jgi:hypothetical protein